ncbi:MAG: universal stress protein [Bacteroidota bacterium]
MASKILFPTDFSEPANKALRFVLPFAEKLEASLVLMHAFTLPTPVMEAPFFAWEKELKRLEAQATPKLELLKEVILVDHPSLPIEISAQMGFPVPSILSAAAEWEVDWIVMGTKGASGLKKVLLGSITAQLIGRSPIPVLAIPENKLSPEIRRVVYATNYDPLELTALERVSRLAERLDAEVLVAHVFIGDNAPPMERWRAFEKLVKAKIEYPKLAFKFLPHYDFQTALRALLSYTGAEILAMCPHKRGLWERLFHVSKTKEVAYDAETPLLAIPEA